MTVNVEAMAVVDAETVTVLRARVLALETVLQELDELVDDYVDVEDGPTSEDAPQGVPRPNLAMRVQEIVRRVLP